MLAHDFFNFFAKRVMIVRSLIGVKNSVLSTFSLTAWYLGHVGGYNYFSLIESDVHAAL